VLPVFAPDVGECPTAKGVEALDESERDNLVRTIALDYVSQNKRRLPTVAVLRVARMMSLYQPIQTWRWEYQIEGRGYWSAGIGMVMWWAMAIPACLGLWWLWRRKLPVLPFVAIVAAIAVTAAGTFGINRYRVPVDMVEVVLFAVAVAAVVDPKGARLAAASARPAGPDATETSEADISPADPPPTGAAVDTTASSDAGGANEGAGVGPTNSDGAAGTTDALKTEVTEDG
jgi:hypothetical protein